MSRGARRNCSGSRFRGPQRCGVQALSPEGEAIFAEEAITTEEERACGPLGAARAGGRGSLAPPDGIAKGAGGADRSSRGGESTDRHDHRPVRAGRRLPNRDNAVRLADRLSALGPARITPVVIDGTEFFRVRIGPLAGVDEADVMLDGVYEIGLLDARIVVE